MNGHPEPCCDHASRPGTRRRRRAGAVLSALVASIAVGAAPSIALADADRREADGHGAVWARLCSADGSIAFVRISGRKPAGDGSADRTDGAQASMACHAPCAILRNQKGGQAATHRRRGSVR